MDAFKEVLLFPIPRFFLSSRRFFSIAVTVTIAVAVAKTSRAVRII